MKKCPELKMDSSQTVFSFTQRVISIELILKNIFKVNNLVFIKKIRSWSLKIS